MLDKSRFNPLGILASFGVVRDNGRLLYIKISIFTAIIFLFLAACDKTDYENQKTTTNPSLIFNSGFEPNTNIVIVDNNFFDFKGQDLSVVPPNSWGSEGLESGEFVDIARILVGGQNVSDTARNTEIVDDPVNPSNKVLKFWGKYPNEGDGFKFRMQADLHSTKGIDTLYYKIRMYLPDDFNVLKRIDNSFTWFTLMEFWNKSTPRENMFRMTVDLKKVNKGLDSLRFGFRTEKYNTTLSKFDRIREHTGTHFPIPLNKWMTIEINIVEGDGKTGRFYMAVTPEGERKQVIFNFTLQTHHPGIAPTGMNYMSPFKFYTYGYLIDSLRNAGKVGQIYWDDFEIWSDSIAYLN